MAFTKREKIAEVLIFLFLVSFPFGRLFSFETQIFGFRVSFLVLDFIAFLSFLFFLFLDVKFLFRSKTILFLTPFLFSFFISWGIFKSLDIFIGALYLFRLIFYLLFGLMVNWFIRKNEKRGKLLFLSLTISIFAFLIFGFWQYVFYYDLTSLKEVGWDDHLWRLTSTLLDPGFAGIVLSFGFVLSLVNFFFIKKTKFWLFVSFLFILGVSLTFSRASYIAFILGSLYFVSSISKKLARILVLLFILLILIVPKPSGEGVNLLRSFSILDRFQNYKESFVIYSKSPLFGVGYNNFCLARKVFLNEENLVSHSCSGADSSFLFILSTTGVVGFLFFLDLFFYLWKKLEDNYWTVCLKTGLLMILVHSQFNNSIFYPWVLGIFVFLFPLAFSAKKRQ